MPTLTIEYTTDAERIQLERAIAYIQEMQRLGATADHGTVLDACETLAWNAGRQLLRDNLAATLQMRADAEKNFPVGSPKGDKTER